jgi:hypothetical protein
MFMAQPPGHQDAGFVKQCRTKPSLSSTKRTLDHEYRFEGHMKQAGGKRFSKTKGEELPPNTP